MGKPSKHVVHTKVYREEAKAYRGYLLVLGYTYKTVQSRYLSLQEFFYFIESKGVYRVVDITPKEIASFYQYLQSRKSYKGGDRLTLKRVRAIMRGVQQFLGYLLQEGKITSSPASHLKFTGAKRQVARRIFSQQEIKELYQAVENGQEQTLLHVGYGCGLRVSEISALNKEDIRTNENLVIVVKGKFSKRRVVPINDSVNSDLQTFIEATKDTGSALFYNRKGTRMQGWTINKVLKKIIKRTKFGSKLPAEALCKIGIHTLRHSIATHLLENGMPAERVQTFLGHAHLQSTQVYTHISQRQISALQR